MAIGALTVSWSRSFHTDRGPPTVESSGREWVVPCLLLLGPSDGRFQRRADTRKRRGGCGKGGLSASPERSGRCAVSATRSDSQSIREILLGRTATLAVENDAAHNFAALRQSLPDPSRFYTDCLYTASGFFTLLKGETGMKDSTFASSGRNSSQRIASERISRGSPSCSRSATGPRHRRSYIGPWCPREYAQGSNCHQNQPHTDDLYTDQALI